MNLNPFNRLLTGLLALLLLTSTPTWADEAQAEIAQERRIGGGELFFENVDVKS